MRPFNGQNDPGIRASIAAINSPRIKYIDTTGWFDTTESVEGLHPLGVANLSSIGPRLADTLAPILAQPTPLPLWSYA